MHEISHLEYCSAFSVQENKHTSLYTLCTDLEKYIAIFKANFFNVHHENLKEEFYLVLNYLEWELIWYQQLAIRVDRLYRTQESNLQLFTDFADLQQFVIQSCPFTESTLRKLQLSATSPDKVLQQELRACTTKIEQLNDNFVELKI